MILISTLPPGVGRDLDVVLNVYDSFYETSTLATLARAFSYFPPIIASVNPKIQPSTGQSMMSIFGSNFGFSDFSNVIVINSYSQNPTWISDTCLVCTVPQGTGKGKNVLLAVGGQSISAKNVYSYQPPQVNVATPKIYPTQAMIWTNITGKSFGVFDSTPVTLVGGTQCLLSMWVSDSVVMSMVSPGVGGSLDLSVLVDSQFGSKNALVSFFAPALTSFSASRLQTNGETNFTIVGNNFGKI
jgi:hypothetical protein